VLISHIFFYFFSYYSYYYSYYYSFSFSLFIPISHYIIITLFIIYILKKIKKKIDGLKLMEHSFLSLLNYFWQSQKN
jgi:hypothetical protein